jgi:hypothetical protein
MEKGKRPHRSVKWSRLSLGLNAKGVLKDSDV